MKWYGNYAMIMGKVGWVIQDFQFQNYTASGSSFTIDQAIVGIVGTFLPAEQAAIVKAALDALSNLGSDDPWYKVWDSSSHSTIGGNFQIVPCDDANGAINSLVMKLSAYAFQTTETTTRFLWSNYNSSSTQLQFSSQTVTLNEDVYSQVRDAIIQKLGANASTFIGNLSI